MSNKKEGKKTVTQEARGLADRSICEVRGGQVVQSN